MLNDRKKKRVWQRVISILCFVVVFCTAYALILPAVTASEETFCQIEEHTHTDECFVSEIPLCGLDPDSSDHVHEDSCYISETPLCQKEEHTHSLQCFSDPQADLETEADWKDSLPDEDELSEDPVENIALIAQSQTGYSASENNYQVGEDGSMNGWNRYGYICDRPYSQESSCFVRWVLKQAGTEMISLPLEQSEWKQYLIEAQFRNELHTDPESMESGDIVLFQKNSDEQDSSEQPFMAGIYDDSQDKEELIVFENGKVTSLNFEQEFKSKEEDKTPARNIIGYFRASAPVKDEQEEIPAEADPSQNQDPVQEEITDEAQPDITDEAAEQEEIQETENRILAAEALETYYAEDDSNSYKLSLSPKDGLDLLDESHEIQEESVPETGAVSLQVSEIETSETDSQVLEADSPDTETVETTTYSVSLLRNETQLNLDDYDLELTILPKTSALNALSEECYPDAVDEADTDLQIAAYSRQEDAEVVSVNFSSTDQEVDPIVLSLNNEAVFTLSSEQFQDPKFTVQYYSYLEVIDDSVTDKDLTLIDTSHGILPDNSAEPSTKNLYLKVTDQTASYSAENKKYEVPTKPQLTPTYLEQEFKYTQAPNASYFNRLIENGNYEIQEIWVLKGNDRTSTNRNDWEIYSPTSVHFTNNPNNTNGKVLITDSTVIRMVYGITKNENFPLGTAFYDYDLSENSESVKITSDNESDTSKRGKGINNPDNYSKNGTRLAFGNANTGTGLFDERWTDSLNQIVWINQYNRLSGGNYKGCSFGITNGLDSNGTLIYSSGIDAPALFNESTSNVKGKTSYTNQNENKLGFKRSGDTYTLSSVVFNGSNALSGLEQFNNPRGINGSGNYETYTGIFTNNFWPLDSKPGNDGLNGVSGSTTTYQGFSGKNRTSSGGGKIVDKYVTSGTFPSADDNKAHNECFGMHFTVDFDLSSDYIGPLEYLFFGDDDMWVYLSKVNDDGSLSESKLVCDIGGIHSSVGEYVNLWDYLEKGSSGKYRLSIFYTERGLSGSTCYMQFTLPSVSNDNPQQNTGSLSVTKTGSNLDDDAEYKFSISLYSDAAHKEALLDNYAYDLYGADGKWIERNIIYSSGTEFSLKKGQQMVVYYIPDGTYFTVTESDPSNITDDPYYVSVSQNGTVVQDYSFDELNQLTISGKVSKGTMVQIVYNNTKALALPETGGPGDKKLILYSALLLSVSASAAVYIRKRRKV